jgi:hypothetical protein
MLNSFITPDFSVEYRTQRDDGRNAVTEITAYFDAKGAETTEAALDGLFYLPSLRELQEIEDEKAS